MFWRVVKTLFFTLVVPGTVAVYVPQSLRNAGYWSLSGQEIPGVALFGLGAMMYLWCAWDFVSKGLGTPAPIDAPRVLVVKGLYRLTRNPMYVGVSAMIFGQAIVYHCASIAYYGSIVLAAFHLFVRFYEEPALRRLFRSQYEDYCRKVPRWIFRLSRA